MTQKGTKKDGTKDKETEEEIKKRKQVKLNRKDTRIM